MSYNPFYNLENPELMRYEYGWVNFVNHNREIKEAVRPEILDSWKRCKKRNMNYMSQELAVETLSDSEISRKIIKRRELLDVALPFMETMIKNVNKKGLATHIVDNEGYVLKSIGEGETDSEHRNYYQIGVRTREADIGTNCIGQTLLTSKPEEVIGSEHYRQLFHKTAGYAAPIFNENGELVAVLGMTGWVGFVNKYILGLVIAAAKAIENEIQLREVQRHIIQQNREQNEILETVTNGVMYVNEHKVITQVNSEIADMLGFEKRELMGKRVNVINTEPEISNIINSRETNPRFEVLVYGKSKVYNCFLTCRHISYDKESKNRVLVFTKMEEIQELAHKINNDTRAFFSFKDILGESQLLNEAKDLAMKASLYGSRVIIEGESGTGKEMFAQAIHNNGKRRRAPFVAVDCGAIPRELLESELFGYEEGAFTGARKGGQRGKFELANGGTIFLDEISNMPIDMQAKMLRVLQENCIYRIGGYKPIPIDVHVIAATNSNLKEDVANKNFREDLFYRLNVIYIKLPALRDRKEDIDFLINDFINKSKKIDGKEIFVEEKVLRILNQYDWPGNIRQLHNTIERMSIMAEDSMVKVCHIPNEIVRKNKVSDALNFDEIESLEQLNTRHIKRVLSFYSGNIKKTAEALEVSRNTVYRVLKK